MIPCLVPLPVLYNHSVGAATLHTHNPRYHIKDESELCLVSAVKSGMHACVPDQTVGYAAEAPSSTRFCCCVLARSIHLYAQPNQVPMRMMRLAGRLKATPAALSSVIFGMSKRLERSCKCCETLLVNHAQAPSTSTDIGAAVGAAPCHACCSQPQKHHCLVGTTQITAEKRREKKTSRYSHDEAHLADARQRIKSETETIGREQ